MSTTYNKVTLDGTTLMDISDTTATESDVASGKTFYKSNGAKATGTASAGSAQNVQIAAGADRVATTSYSAVSGQTLTVSKAGTYDIYWVGFRSSTGGTNGSCLYVNGAAHSSGVQTAFTNHAQSIHLTGVSLAQGDVVSVRARARGTNYYMYVGNLTLIQSA